VRLWWSAAVRLFEQPAVDYVTCLQGYDNGHSQANGSETHGILLSFCINNYTQARLGCRCPGAMCNVSGEGQFKAQSGGPVSGEG